MDDAAWEDPELRQDRLPQPYRFLNTLLEKIIESALTRTRPSFDKSLLESRHESRSQTFHPLKVSDGVELGEVSCTALSENGTVLAVGNSSGQILAFFLDDLNKRQSCSINAYKSVTHSLDFN